MITKSEYEYAQRNGFKGSIDEYLQFNYELYCASCVRLDMVAKSFGNWKQERVTL